MRGVERLGRTVEEEKMEREEGWSQGDGEKEEVYPERNH